MHIHRLKHAHINMLRQHKKHVMQTQRQKLPNMFIYSLIYINMHTYIITQLHTLMLEQTHLFTALHGYIKDTKDLLVGLFLFMLIEIIATLKFNFLQKKRYKGLLHSDSMSFSFSQQAGKHLCKSWLAPNSIFTHSVVLNIFKISRFLATDCLICIPHQTAPDSCYP